MTGPLDLPPIRESPITGVIAGFFAYWGTQYTIDLIGRADQVTSTQWRYLMSVPGGRWSWITVFGVGSALLILGLCGRHYRTRAAGLTILGFGALAIAAFYICAPLIDPGLTTLGWHPWWPYGPACIGLAIFNTKPIRWRIGWLTR